MKPPDNIAGYDPIATALDGQWFDDKAADRAVDFIETHCSHVKGPKTGEPFLLEPWQKDYVRTLFGWKRADDTRRYRRSILYIPRKNGKTPLAACILLYLIGADDEGGAEVYSGASSRDQAAKLYDWMQKMIGADRVLSEEYRVYTATKRIVHDRSNSEYQALSSDGHTAHGSNTHACVVDELHVISKPEFLEAIETSFGARTQPMLLFLTTADYDRESLCNTEYDYACKVRDGVLDDSAYLPVIYEAPVDVAENGTWRNPEVWEACNPNLGVSVQREFLEAEARRAESSPAKLGSFLRLYLNVRVGTKDSIVNLDDWRQCEHFEANLEPEGADVYLALDMSSNMDLTSLCASWEHEGVPVFRWWFWLPDEDIYERQHVDRAPYTDWHRDGWLDLTPGPRIEQTYVEQVIEDLATRWNVVKIVVDPWNSLGLASRLDAAGLTVEQYPQNFKYFNWPTKRIQELCAVHGFCHGGNPIAQWCVSNVVLMRDNHECIKPVKKQSTGRIDGTVAQIMAEGARSGVFGENVETVPSNPYADRGVPAL